MGIVLCSEQAFNALNYYYIPRWIHNAGNLSSLDPNMQNRFQLYRKKYIFRIYIAAI